jgi:hypothetical protein
MWIYDSRTNQNFTLKTRALVRADLDNFVACYNPANHHDRTETERFRAFSYDELVARDKASLDIFWLRDKSLEDVNPLTQEPGFQQLFGTVGSDLGRLLMRLDQRLRILNPGLHHAGSQRQPSLSSQIMRSPSPATPDAPWSLSRQYSPGS